MTYSTLVVVSRVFLALLALIGLAFLASLLYGIAARRLGWTLKALGTCLVLAALLVGVGVLIMHYQSRVPDWVTVEQVRDEYASDLDTLRKLAEDQVIGPPEVARRWNPEDKVKFAQPEILGAELVLTNGGLHILKHGGAEVVYHFQPPWVKQAPGAYLARGENRPGGPHAGADLVVYVEPLAPSYSTALEIRLTFEPEGLRARLKGTGSHETRKEDGPNPVPSEAATPRD
jgi:hypothetical protein